mgnify:CR=1 FL=1
MIRSLDHCIDLIAKRKSLGKKGIPKSVRRFLKRKKLSLDEIIGVVNENK